MRRLWDKGQTLDDRIARFTVGSDPRLDRELVAYDALGSAAHATMLQRIGILQASELDDLLRELSEVAQQGRAGRFEIRLEQEDCHTAIENRLTERLGDAGRRVHTGRSRNDQVIAAIRLWARERLLALAEQLASLVEQLLDLAERHREWAMPGYTHTRQAMPSTFGLFFGAHAEGLLDAWPWLQAAFAHINRSPLGSASGYGVALPLDRRLVAELLQFDALQNNTLAVQNDRGRTEMMLLSALQMPAVDLGRLATDLIWFSSEEFGFVELAPEVTTGSSIMPQKRNPDVLELVRAAAARVQQRQAEIGGVYSRLTSGYHRDLQLTKQAFMEGLQDVGDLVAAMQVTMKRLRVVRDKARAALVRSIGATDEVYRRVADGQPFRRAYDEVAADPEGVVRGDVAELWRARQHDGAPGNLRLDMARERLGHMRLWLHETGQRIARAWDLLHVD